MDENVTLKSGIEIHQQLDTGKLFCDCPGLLRKDNPDYIVERKLHEVAGETGVVDVAVKFEKEKDRKFVYQCYEDNNCLIELDEEPPHQINQEALKIALQISLLLNCKILQNAQIMRKTVIDGSNVSGFQRTVLIGREGYIETDEGKVGIQSVVLEEDAARIIEKNNDKVVYRLDRLGIPLIEIATAPDIKTPEQAKQVALHLGDILRSCKVKRGIGTIRQDVNLSIKSGKKQGKRIEIKGVQELKLIEKTIIKEMERQKKLVGKNESKAEVRKALPDGETKFLRPLPGSSRMYPETDLPLLHISKSFLDRIKKNLPKLKSEIREELKNKGLSKELIKILMKNNKVPEFRELIQVYENAELIAKILTLWIPDLAAKSGKNVEEVEEKLTLDIIEEILQKVKKKQIRENEVQQILEEILNGKELEEALKREKVENIEEEVMKLIKEKPGLNPNAYMGLIMGKYKGKVNPKEVMQIILKLLNK